MKSVVTDLGVRGAALFGVYDADVAWPYGLTRHDYNLSELRKKDPEEYSKKWSQLTDARETLVGWAEKYELTRTSAVGCCPQWLLRKVSRRCPYTADTCTRRGPGHDCAWMDHPIWWLKDGRPAVLTSAPYPWAFGADEQAKILRWASEHPNLSTAQGEGWYGFNTRQVVLWRNDRITDIEPARLPVRD